MEELQSKLQEIEEIITRAMEQAQEIETAHCKVTEKERQITTSSFDEVTENQRIEMEEETISMVIDLDWVDDVVEMLGEVMVDYPFVEMETDSATFNGINTELEPAVNLKGLQSFYLNRNKYNPSCHYASQKIGRRNQSFNYVYRTGTRNR